MTNTRSRLTDPEQNDAIDYEQAQKAARMLLDALGEDPDRPGLRETWERRVPDALTTLTAGTRVEAKPDLRTFPAESDDLIVKTGIPVYSLCEHHMLPFHGTVQVAYRPDEEIGGLSKLTRYVRWRSRQITVQERLTKEIATGLYDELEAHSVIVEMHAAHLCEAMRGVETPSTTTTRATAGTPHKADITQFQAAVDRAEGQR